MEESKLTGKNENNIDSEISDNLHTSVFYNFDYSTNKYSFLSSSIEELTGYTLQELTKINFSDLIITKQDISSEELRDEDNLKEDTAKYSIKIKNGEEKLIEDSFIILTNPKDKKKKRLGIIRDVSKQINDEKINKIISEILEIADSEKNLEDLFSFIHSQIKKLMKADNFYIAYYKKDSNMLTFPYFVDEEDTDSSAQVFGKGLTEYKNRQISPG